MVTHIIGGAFGIFVTVICIIRSAMRSLGALSIVGSAIFGGAMVVLYTVSSIYHGLSPKLMGKKVFRILDHCSIFIMIAGTYTPISLISLARHNIYLGWTIFSVEWAMAVLGILLNSIDLERYKKVSMVCYLVMGWCVVITLKPTLEALSFYGFMPILLGGIAYTIGACLYGIGKKKRYMHSVFHIFVVIGSVFQFFGIYCYVLK